MFNKANEENQNPLRWTLDPETWIRTCDFSPLGEIGSSYLYK